LRFEKLFSIIRGLSQQCVEEERNCLVFRDDGFGDLKALLSLDRKLQHLLGRIRYTAKSDIVVANQAAYDAFDDALIQAQERRYLATVRHAEFEAPHDEFVQRRDLLPEQGRDLEYHVVGG